MKKILIIGVNSGIGESLALQYLEDNAIVIGTYRTTPSDILNASNGIDLYQLDVIDSDSIALFIESLQNKEYRWDIVIFSVGLLEPIGNFFELNFTKWEASYSTNFFGQLKVMHEIRKFANPDATAIFFTGGAPNGVLHNFSAYSVAKIGLTKMVEYLDAEDNNVKYAIVGPGWVDTKIHEQTITAGNQAGENLERTSSFLKNKEQGTRLIDIYDCINWIVKKSKKIVGGRNFSVVWDTWGNRSDSDKLEYSLMHNNDFFKLRRFDS